MKSFFKNVFANIVAIMIIVAIFCLSLVLMIAANALSDNKKPNVKDNSILTLDFRTGIIDSPSEDTQEFFSFSEKEKNVLIFDILKAIKNAKTDDKIILNSINLYICSGVNDSTNSILLITD